MGPQSLVAMSQFGTAVCKGGDSGYASGKQTQTATAPAAI